MNGKPPLVSLNRVHEDTFMNFYFSRVSVLGPEFAQNGFQPVDFPVCSEIQMLEQMYIGPTLTPLSYDLDISGLIRTSLRRNEAKCFCYEITQAQIFCAGHFKLFPYPRVI